MRVDFHTHILPKIDDGSADPNQSIAMLKMEQEQGVDCVVLTPHFYANVESPKEFLDRRAKSLCKLMESYDASLPRLLLGAEVQYFEGICGVEDIDSLKIEGTDLLLLEMPYRNWSEWVIQEVLALQDRENTVVVLAHVDRYMHLMSEAIQQRLLDAGVLFQVNAFFLYDWRCRLQARKMLRLNRVHFVGSDCHNLDSRCPDIHKVEKLIAKYGGNFRTDLLFQKTM